MTERKLRKSGPKPISTRTALVGSLDWQEHGACVGRPGDLFHEVGRDRDEKTIARLNQALTLCRSCPVIEPCRAFGIDNKESGVWGGLFLNMGHPVRVSRELIR